MGTNYDWTPTPCPTCGHAESLHIGKSSMGWVFALHIYPDKGIHELDDWIRKFSEGTIEDEYGREVSPADMIAFITRRSRKRSPGKPMGYDSWHDFHRENHSTDGPCGLLRSDPARCRDVKPGAGTYDLHTGDFR